jgi:hypothetical protein
MVINSFMVLFLDTWGMDWTRRRFLLSTTLIAGIAGCSGTGSPPSQPTASHPTTGTSSSTTTDTDSDKTPSPSEPEMTAGTPTPTMTRTGTPGSPVASTVARTEHQTVTQTETGTTTKIQTETGTTTKIQTETGTTTKIQTETGTTTQTQTETGTTTQTQTETETATQSPTATQQSTVAESSVETQQPIVTESPTETQQPIETETETESETESLYVGKTIPQMPHAPGEAIHPTGSTVHPSAATPVLRASDVTDYGDVDYVADPFMFVEDGTWHMFFEILNDQRSPDAPIGHATSPDGLDWTYNQVILEKKYHTSFPFVWKYRGEYYMCPPTGTKVELYKAQQFPTDWTYIGNAIDVDYYSHDPTFVRYQGRWWLFTDRGNENVMVYHSTDLEAEGWTPHSQNPVVTDRRHAGRQGGRPIVVGDQLYLYFQDGVENYGDAVRCYEVTNLSPSTYADREVAGSPVLHEFGTDWASEGMHTFDPWWRGPGKGWRCAVDGVRAQEDIEDLWTIGILDIPPSE